MKKSNNISKGDWGNFSKIASQHTHKNGSFGVITTGIRYSYKEKEPILHLKIEQLSDEMKVMQTISLQVRKKDLKRLISLFEYTIKFDENNIEEEIND